MFRSLARWSRRVRMHERNWRRLLSRLKARNKKRPRCFFYWTSIGWVALRFFNLRLTFSVALAVEKEPWSVRLWIKVCASSCHCMSQSLFSNSEYTPGHWLCGSGCQPHVWSWIGASLIIHDGWQPRLLGFMGWSWAHRSRFASLLARSRKDSWLADFSTDDSTGKGDGAPLSFMHWSSSLVKYFEIEHGNDIGKMIWSLFHRRWTPWYSWPPRTRPFRALSMWRTLADHEITIMVVEHLFDHVAICAHKEGSAESAMRSARAAFQDTCLQYYPIT